MQRSALCRSRRAPSHQKFSYMSPFSQSPFQIDPNSNECLLANFSFDTAENEPCKVCPLSVYRYYFPFETPSGSLPSASKLQARGSRWSWLRYGRERALSSLPDRAVERPHREGEAEVQHDAPGLVDLDQYSRLTFVNFVSISQQSSHVRDIL